MTKTIEFNQGLATTTHRLQPATSYNQRHHFKHLYGMCFSIISTINVLNNISSPSLNLFAYFCSFILSFFLSFFLWFFLFLSFSFLSFFSLTYFLSSCIRSFILFSCILVLFKHCRLNLFKSQKYIL